MAEIGGLPLLVGIRSVVSEFSARGTRSGEIHPAWLTRTGTAVPLALGGGVGLSPRGNARSQSKRPRLSSKFTGGEHWRAEQLPPPGCPGEHAIGAPGAYTGFAATPIMGPPYTGPPWGCKN
eukprot:CAMPEP_0117583248 /NCGR_PEP_ID=MMETSP0784-20121206/66903_1 /TAXON_ID=39447 /ORGANISM="" /LENGTH=121 /DNA_ID=CAMNT_0005383901 /DNA_START=108 /DNA_END=470 /DNA_ORIENTATION=+